MSTLDTILDDGLGVASDEGLIDQSRPTQDPRNQWESVEKRSSNVKEQTEGDDNFDIGNGDGSRCDVMDLGEAATQRSLGGSPSDEQ